VRRREDVLREKLREFADVFKAWGATGGKERAKRLTAEQRKAIAKKAARARWAKAKKEARC
jgi:hypothetical protein